MKTKKHLMHKGLVGLQRKRQKEQGYFDGRFVSRLEESKKQFTRKIKHKKNIKSEYYGIKKLN